MVDVVVEIVDARMPVSSRNADLNEIISKKSSIKKIVILNKADLADKEETIKWKNKLSENGNKVIEVIADKGLGVDTLKKELESYKFGVRSVKTVVIGIPNVGKSTLINKILGKNSLEAKNKAGVTKNLKWVRINEKITMLDSPRNVMA